MARARLLKPSFFKNEELADLGQAARLLFAGLWCLADRSGRLEDRPRRIKTDVLPYDDCDVDALLTLLHEHGFIRRYGADGDRYIEVINFLKHQTPHVKEAKSTIPAPDEPSASPVQDTAHFPSSFKPIPEALTGSLDLGPEPERAPAREEPPPPPESLQDFHSILAKLPGYDPAPEFYAKVAEKYGRLDLVEEALRIASWCQSQPRGPTRCSTGFVLKWLKNSEDERIERGKEVNGHADRASVSTAGRGTQGHDRGGRARGRISVNPADFAGIDSG